jgi:hypothetical protein
VGFLRHFHNLLGHEHDLTVQSFLTAAINRADEDFSLIRHEYDDCTIAVSCLERYFEHEPDQIPYQLERIAFDEHSISGIAPIGGLRQSKRICGLL